MVMRITENQKKIAKREGYLAFVFALDADRQYPALNRRGYVGLTPLNRRNWFGLGIPCDWTRIFNRTDISYENKLELDKIFMRAYTKAYKEHFVEAYKPMTEAQAAQEDEDRMHAEAFHALFGGPPR